MMKLFRSIRKAYGNLRLNTKLALIVFMAVLIPLLIIFALLSGSFLEMITSDTIRREQTAASATAPLLSDAVKNITDTADSIAELDFYQKIFDEVEDQDADLLLSGSDAAAFRESVKECIRDTNVTAVRFYIDLPSGSRCFSSASDEIFSPLSKMTADYWYGICYSTHPSELFCPPFYLNNYERKNLGDCAYIRPVAISRTDGNYIRGYMVCYFSSDTLSSILNSHLTDVDNVSYITSNRDSIVCSTNARLAGLYYLDYDTIYSSMLSSNGFLTRNVLGEKVYAGYYAISGTDWILVTILPEKQMQKQNQHMIAVYLLIIFISTFAGILIAIGISRSTSSRIIAVSRQMKQVRSSPPVPMDTPEYSDEIGDLVSSYNYMATTINTLIRTQKEQAEELRDAEFRSLQAQINPHFLYNTMEMINWMAQQGRTKETGAAIRDLSRFYKLTLSRKDPISTVENEIEHISIYVRLQNMRFDNGIDLVVDIPDSLLDHRIPRLTFQPIIENSILHGILEKESKRGTIVLTGWEEDGATVILISDDGVGIPPEKLETLLSGDDIGREGKGSHIAVYNTHRRLQILYGEEYGLRYTSKVGKGTDVEIRVPD